MRSYFILFIIIKYAITTYGKKREIIYRGGRYVYSVFRRTPRKLQQSIDYCKTLDTGELPQLKDRNLANQIGQGLVKVIGKGKE